LASIDSARIKALAQARLMKKHNVLASMKKEATDSDSGPSDHGRKANLDTQISGSSKWLAKAVMVSLLYALMCVCYMRLCVRVFFFLGLCLWIRGELQAPASRLPRL
jgi:hypothetical protein